MPKLKFVAQSTLDQHNANATQRALKSGRTPKLKLLPATNYVDFRPGIDVVLHENGRCLIRDTQGLKADVTILTDILPPDKLKALEETPFEQIGMKAQATRLSPLLSSEGRAQRLQALTRAWETHCGKALFVAQPA